MVSLFDLSGLTHLPTFLTQALQVLQNCFVESLHIGASVLVTYEIVEVLECLMRERPLRHLLIAGDLWTCGELVPLGPVRGGAFMQSLEIRSIIPMQILNNGLIRYADYFTSYNNLYTLLQCLFVERSSQLQGNVVSAARRRSLRREH